MVSVQILLLVCLPALTLSGEQGGEQGDYASLLQAKVQVHSAPEESYLAQMSRKARALFNRKQHLKDTVESRDAVRLLDFTRANIVYNNLGGQGPVREVNGAAAPEEIRYSNLVVGQDVDLVVTAAPGYQAFNNDRNGILQGNGQINAKSGTNVSLQFKFVEAGTYTPVVMPLFYITFSDIDERHLGTEYESMTVYGYDEYYTNDDLTVQNEDSDTPTFVSSDYGNYSDNAFFLDSPSPTQLTHAVSYKFTDKASFDAVFEVATLRDINKGRNILFSGISQLVMCQQPSVYLDFSAATVTNNNLGGAGPNFQQEHNLRYSYIGYDSTGALDLVVTADEDYGYIASNSSQNGLHGNFGHINLFCGPAQNNSEAYLTFTIVRSGTSDPVVLPQFAMVVFDFDMGLHEQQREYVEIRPNRVGFDGGNGYSSYIVTQSTEVNITDGQHGKRFAATRHGTEADNPTSSQNMARETADKSVVFTFRSTSSFRMTLGITPAGADSGRNFMFSGQDMYLMCD